MADYPNFYESLKEANMRLNSTVVMYEGIPYYVLGITDHRGDGKFRIYLIDLGKLDEADEYFRVKSNLPGGHSSLGVSFDELIIRDKFPFIHRKYMTSAGFNKFRPFSLGMMNVKSPCAAAVYVERQPNRKTEQGLIQSMLCETFITASTRNGNLKQSMATNILSEEFKDCILANHPSPKEAIEAIVNPKIQNESIAFHRQFALVRGPVDMVFLAYKSDIVGYLPYGDYSRVKLAKNFQHTREVISELNLFASIQ